jgi:putative redox protein
MDITVTRGEGALQHIIEIGPHRLLTDAPKAFGGEETGPEPHDYLAAALGACTALTVTMYAKRKEWPLENIDVQVRHNQEGDTYVFHRHIRYVGNLSADDKARLTEIANKCPIHKTLTAGRFAINTEAE